MYTLTQPALALAVACSPHPTQTHVISTGGGAFAAAAERPLYFAFITLRKPVTLGVMQEISYVYILASGFKHLYIGVTTEIEHRIFQHKNNTYANSFTARYNIKDLVYFERFADLSSAIAREKQLKRWSRIKKIALIVAQNPTWRDLSEDWHKPTEPFKEENLRPPRTFPQNNRRP